MIPPEPTKYTLLETLFCDRWQWVRRRSRQYWVKCREPGYSWVKFTNENLVDFFGTTDYQFDPKNYETEDWRKG